MSDTKQFFIKERYNIYLQILIWSLTMPSVMIGFPLFIQKITGEKRDKHTTRAIKRVLFNVYFTLPFLVLFTNIMFYKNWIDTNFPKVDRVLIEIFAILFFTDTTFYWWHRFLHTKFMYRLHKHHHSFRPTQTIAYVSMSLFEFVFENLSYFCGAPFIGIWLHGSLHVVSWALSMLYILIQGTLIHNSNLKWKSNILNSPHAHQIHHQYGSKNGNFGLLTMFWDRICGTVINK
jgi:sterol desaturase/sphingolipid hydroxylase (fatty acid hydroxylase superfamily)